MFVTAMLFGMKIGYYSGDVKKILEDLKALKPTIFPSVPRLFNGVYDKILLGLSTKSSLAKNLFDYALKRKLFNLKKFG